MKNKKLSGSFYTPSILSDFLVKHIFSNFLQHHQIKILEPSCGDGEFITPLFINNVLNRFESVDIDLVETDEIAINKTKSVIQQNKSENIHTEFYNSNYLDFDGKGYSLIFGNPPYINKKHLKKEDKLKCEKICEEVIPTIGETKNIWPAFLLKSILSLSDKGVLCFVLPSEILQVNYARKIRDYLLEAFQRIEIFAFNELIFEGIQQDVIVLIGIKNVLIESDKGVSFFQVDKLKDLKIPDYVLKHNNVHRKNLDKWSNFILSDDELNFVEEVVEKLQLKKVNNYCDKAEVGIVTAANDYFIINSEIVNEKGLKKYAQLILQKGTQIQKSLRVNKEIINKLSKENKKIYFLHFPEKPKEELTDEAQAYIIEGEKLELHKRYKMERRNYWYHVPTTWISQGMFLKRSHLFPKIIINEANLCVTDSFYRINMKNEYNIKDLAFSFYNTLSFVLAELEGRFYGGGVLELTPNEFKNLYVPYYRTTNEQIRYLERMIESDVPINIMLNYSDEVLLEKLSSEERITLKAIWNKLLDRRRKISRKIKSINYKVQENSLQVAEPTTEVWGLT